jgi:hypothetical protein
MLDTFVERKIRELVAMTRDAAVPMNLRVAWATFGLVHGDDRWSDETRRELGELNTAFEHYIGKAELAKFGQGARPTDEEFAALIDQIRGLERLLPVPRPGGASA